MSLRMRIRRAEGSPLVIVAALALAVAGCGSGSGSGTGAPSAGTASGASAACGSSATSATLDSLQVTVNGTRRQAVVRIPAGARPGQPLPVLMSFHGAAGDPSMQENLDGFAPSKDSVVVYPEGLPVTLDSGISGVTGWDVAGTKTNEPAFVAALLDALGSAVCVDLHRVFVAGMSNGASLAVSLPCALPGRIAGVAAVEAAYWALPCPDGKPTPTLFLHGLDDRFTPFAGERAPLEPLLPVMDVVTATAKRNGCTGGPVKKVVGPTVTTLTWTGCTAPTVLYELTGNGHAWPGHPLSVSEPELQSYIESDPGSKTIGAAHGLTAKDMAENMLLTTSAVDASTVISAFFASLH